MLSYTYTKTGFHIFYVYTYSSVCMYKDVSKRLNAYVRFFTGLGVGILYTVHALKVQLTTVCVCVRDFSLGTLSEIKGNFMRVSVCVCVYGN
jgi:hypothetical protein